jgi:hypothetical protein
VLKYRDVSGWGLQPLVLDFGKRMGFSSLKEDYKNKIDKIDVKKH